MFDAKICNWKSKKILKKRRKWSVLELTQISPQSTHILTLLTVNIFMKWWTLMQDLYLDAPCGDMTWMSVFLQERRDVIYSGKYFSPQDICMGPVATVNGSTPSCCEHWSLKSWYLAKYCTKIKCKITRGEKGSWVSEKKNCFISLQGLIVNSVLFKWSKSQMWISFDLIF